MPAVTATTALVIAASAAALGAGATVYSAERQAKGQKKDLEAQESAQREALSKANQEQRKADQAFAAANKKKPDMAAIMASSSRGASQGAASTNLTGTKTSTMLGE